MHPEHKALRRAFNAMVMCSFDGEPLYRTHNDIGQAMPPAARAAVIRVLSPPQDWLQDGYMEDEKQ